MACDVRSQAFFVCAPPARRMLLRHLPSPTHARYSLKKVLSYSMLALTIAVTMSACKRAEPPAATSSEAAPAISLQKIDTVVGTGKEATAGSTAVVNYTGWLYEPKAESQHGAKFD